MLQFLHMGKEYIQAKREEIAYLSASHRLQSNIEDHLVTSGKNSLQMKSFDDQLRLRTAVTEKERNIVKWDIWEQFVWTPGYVDIYANTKHLISSWTDVLVSEIRTDYGFAHGIHALRRDEAALRSQVIADLPKRMHALASRAQAKAGTTAK